MPGIEYSLGLDNEAFVQGAAQSMDYINQLHGRIDKLSTAGGGGNGFLKGLSTTLFQLPQQVAALQGMMETLSIPSKLAASAETTAVAFKVLVGDAALAEKVLGKLNKLADSTPLEFPELAGAARMLVAFGESAEDVDVTLRKVGDIATAIGAPIGEMAELYGKARVQGTLFADDLNQLTGRGVPILQEFAKQLGVSTDEIKGLASNGQITFQMLEQAFTDLTSGAGKYNNMMSVLGETMEGKLSTLSGNFKGVMTAIGEGINEALKPLVAGAAVKFDSMKEGARGVGKALGEAIDTAVIAFDTGKIGQVIFQGFSAGALIVADKIVAALDWGGAMMAAKLVQVAPFTSKSNREEGALAEETLMNNGLNGMGSPAAAQAADKASKDFAATLNDIKSGVAERKAQRDEDNKAAQSKQDQTKVGAELGKALGDAFSAVKEKVDKMTGKTNFDSKAGFEFGPAAAGKSGDGNSSIGGGSTGIGGGSLVPLASDPTEEYAKRFKVKSPPSRRADQKDEYDEPDIDTKGGDAPASSHHSDALGRRTIKGVGYGKKDGPREGLGYFKTGKMKTPDARVLRDFAARQKIRGVGGASPLDSMATPAKLGTATGRGQARQAKQAEAAEREQGKAKASNSGGSMETMVRKIAEQVAMIAKAKESEQTI